MKNAINQVYENPAGDDQLIPVTQAAPLAQLSASHLRYLVRTGKVVGRKLGRDWFTSKAALDAYLATERKPGPKTNRDTIESS